MYCVDEAGEWSVSANSRKLKLKITRNDKWKMKRFANANMIMWLMYRIINNHCNSIILIHSDYMVSSICSHPMQSIWWASGLCMQLTRGIVWSRCFRDNSILSKKKNIRWNDSMKIILCMPICRRCNCSKKSWSSSTDRTKCMHLHINWSLWAHFANGASSISSCGFVQFRIICNLFSFLGFILKTIYNKILMITIWDDLSIPIFV